MLYLNNIPGSNVGVVVEHRPPRPVPRRKTLSWDVPGRNGKVIKQLDAWENVSLPYELAVIPAHGVALGAAVDAAVAWLTQPGYMRLYDDTDPDVFYLAAYPGGQDLEPVLHRARRVKVSFDAMPQRWLLSGEEPVTLYAAGTIANPTDRTAKPLITLSGAGEGTLTLGTMTMSFSDCSGLVLDCEAHRASGNDGTVSGSWPEFPAGETAISWTGGVTAVEIVPRWFVI